MVPPSSKASSLLQVLRDEGLDAFFAKLVEPTLSPLLAAASQGNTEEVQRLLEQEDADVNEMDTYGRTPLIYAIMNRHLATVQFLLEKGADMYNFYDYHGRYRGWTPLMHASYTGHYAMVRLLLEKHHNPKGPQQGEPDDDGSTSFINDTTHLGSTALAIASFNGHFRVACLLLHHGANAWIANRLGMTPADIAKGECKRIDWRTFMQYYMITPSNLSSFIVNNEDTEITTTWTVMDEQPLQKEQCQGAKSEPVVVVTRREMMPSTLLRQETHDIIHMQQHHPEALLQAEMEEFRKAILPEMAAIRQENATLRDMLQTLI